MNTPEQDERPSGRHLVVYRQRRRFLKRHFPSRPCSNQQSAGISQVGDAIGQMDTVTQQNAALVEESAAAAESLKGQAQQLVQAVAVFKMA